ncbi:MAG: 4'-phosphopantetheinyl transferase superfamily protein [Burkholderiales bacterium]|nr:MAG: 4'-phosphopantetheinyl transferase superfamily protein [Burkholderiales bacterium]
MTSSLPVNLVYAKLSELDLGRAREELLPSLPAADQCRYASLRRPERREQFLAGRLLAREGRSQGLLGLDPREPDFPGLNISHSGPWVACAFTPRGQVGCDVERVIPRAIDTLAEVACSLSERARLADRQAGDPMALFYRYWTVKEALAKACRQGLALDLRTLEVSLDSGALFYPSSIVPGSHLAAISVLLEPFLAGAMCLFHDDSCGVDWRWWRREASPAWREVRPILANPLSGRPGAPDLTAQA